MRILGNGVDIVEVARIKRSIRRWGDYFLKRIFTPHELHYVQKKKNPYESLAARFATKEAVIKAFGERKDRPLSLKQVEIINTAQGVPKVVLHGPNGKSLLRLQKDVRDLVVSMSHSRSYAVGTALLVGKKASRKKR